MSGRAGVSIATLVGSVLLVSAAGCSTSDPMVSPERVWTPEELVTAMLPAGSEEFLGDFMGVETGGDGFINPPQRQGLSRLRCRKNHP